MVTDHRPLDPSARTAEQAIAEVAARVPADRRPAGAGVAGLAIARERELPTAPGHGVAVPHARVPGLARPLVVPDRSAAGAVFGPRSPDLVHLVFLLVTPADQPSLQVILLAQVARAAGDPGTRERLRTAASPAEVEAVLAAVPADGPPSRPGTPTSAVPRPPAVADGSGVRRGEPHP